MDEWVKGFVAGGLPWRDNRLLLVEQRNRVSLSNEVLLVCMWRRLYANEWKVLKWRKCHCSLTYSFHFFVLQLYHHGAHVCFGRLPENHLQRWKAWSTTSVDPTFFQGHYQILAENARARYVSMRCCPREMPTGLRARELYDSAACRGPDRGGGECPWVFFDWVSP